MDPADVLYALVIVREVGCISTVPNVVHALGQNALEDDVRASLESLCQKGWVTRVAITDHCSAVEAAEAAPEEAFYLPAGAALSEWV